MKESQSPTASPNESPTNSPYKQNGSPQTAWGSPNVNVYYNKKRGRKYFPTPSSQIVMSPETKSKSQHTATTLRDSYSASNDKREQQINAYHSRDASPRSSSKSNASPII